MGLHSLHLTRFRTFDEYQLDLNPEAVTVFMSPNGTGKTSVLEAIFVMVTGNSFRTSSSGDLMMTGSEKSSAKALVFSQQRRLEFDVTLTRGVRAVTKKLTINKQRPTTLSALYEAFPVTVFTPEGVDMVRRDPGERRAFISHLAISLTPRVSDVVERFERVLKQRNAVLRSHGDHPSFVDLQRDLAVWDEEFIRVSEELVAARESSLALLNPVTENYYTEISQGQGRVTLRYEPSWSGSLRTALHEALPRDIARGYTTLGPHRDDVSIQLDGRDARRQASQGEQRSVALSMLLAGDHLVRSHRSLAPLLMLDDVFSELDPFRSSQLLALLPPGQTLVTAASPLPAGLQPADMVDVTMRNT